MTGCRGNYSAQQCLPCWSESPAQCCAPAGQLYSAPAEATYQTVVSDPPVPVIDPIKVLQSDVGDLKRYDYENQKNIDNLKGRVQKLEAKS